MTATTSMPVVRSDGQWGFRLAIALSALLALRLLGVTFAGTDLFFDEAQYWAWSREPAFGYYSKPPMIAWIIAGATSACGDGEACIRAPSAILHTATSAIVFAIGRHLYDARTGFYAGLAFATLPGISLSSGLISTDVPLLLFWAAALYAWIRLVETRSFFWALGLGAALGLGMLSKYAMIYFAACIVAHAAVSPRARATLVSLQMAVAAGAALSLISPNILWNLENGLATVRHTADNANLKEAWLRPGKAAEFLGAQFGVMGPILFGALIACVWRGLRRGADDARLPMLLAFSLPPIVIVTTVALLSRAHANWAAVAYPAATIAAVAMLLHARPRLLDISLALHLAIAIAIPAAVASAQHMDMPGGVNPFARTLGWRDMAAEILDVAEARGAQAILSDDRAVTAELLYYGRHKSTPILALPAGAAPRDHFEMTSAVDQDAPKEALYVSPHGGLGRIERLYGRITAVGSVALPGGRGRRAQLYFVEDPKDERR
jgi:hypothetical protein